MGYDGKMRFIYPFELIRTGIVFLYNTRQINTTSDGSWYLYRPWRAMVLYCLQKVDKGWLPLNREYKPLGICYYSPNVVYEEYPFMVIPEAEIEASSAYLIKHDHTDSMFLFDDGSYPETKKCKDAYVRAILDIFPIMKPIEKTIKRGREFY